MDSRGSTVGRVAVAISALIGIALMLLIKDRKLALIVFIGLTWVESSFFVVRYGFFSAWNTTAGGKAIFYHILSFWVLMTWIGMSVFSDQGFPPFREDIREFLYMAFAVGFFNMNLTLVRIQRGHPSDVKLRNPLKNDKS